MRVTCSIQGEKVQMRIVSVGERALGRESAAVVGMMGVGGERLALEVGSRGSSREAMAGAGEGEGVRPVEVGSEGVGRVLRVKCGRASL